MSDAHRPVLGGDTGHLPAPVLGALPPVQFDHCVPPSLAKPVPQPQRYKPGDRGRQGLDRVGVKVIVMVVREHGEGGAGNGRKRHARWVVARGQQRALAEVRVSEKDILSVVNGKG